MKKNILFAILFQFILLACYAQKPGSDSLTIDQKFERLQFQIDSLKSVGSINYFDKSSIIDDTLQKKLVKAEKEIKAIRHNLYLYYRQQRTANVTTFVGLGIAAFGVIMVGTSTFGSDFADIAGTTLLTGGFVMSGVMAPIIRMDANKFLRYAGKKYKSELRN